MPEDDLDRLLADLSVRDTSRPPAQRATRERPITEPQREEDLSRLLASRDQGETPDGGAPAEATDERTSGTVARGFADMAGFGVADEVGGFFQALGLTNENEPRETIWNSDSSFGDILSRNIAKNRRQFAADQEDRPGRFLAGQVGGAVIMPWGAGARGALQVAKVGAAQGALYGAGSGEGLADRAKKSVLFGAGGAVAGAVVGRVVERAAPVVRRLFGRPAKEAAEEGSEVAARSEAPRTVEGWTNPTGQGDRLPVVSRLDDELDEVIPLSAADDAAPVGTRAMDGPEGAATSGSVGSISRAGLQDLQDQVASFRARVAGEEGPRAVDVTPGSPEYASLGAFRLGNLGDGPDTMSLLGALVRQLPQQAAKGDAELMAAAKAASDEMGVGDPEAVEALARQISGPLGDADSAIATLRTVQRRAAETVDHFHGAGIDWATATDEMVQEAGQAVYNVQRLNGLVQSARAGVGRALRVFSLPDSDAYLSALARGETIGRGARQRTIPPLPGNREELSDFFELWGMTKGNPEMQGDLLAGTLTVPTANHYLASSMANLFTASILSAPKTIILNVAGPAVINTVRALEKMSGGALGAINPFATAAERAAQAEVARATPIALFRTLGDIRDVFRYGVQAFRDNAPVLGGGGTVRDADVTFGPYNSNLLKAAGADPDWRYSLGNALNLFPKAFARLNAGLDELSKRLTYLNEVRVRAMVEAAGEGLEGEAARSYVAQIMKSSVDEAGAATSESLLRAAERSTLTLHPGAEDTLARKGADFIQSLRRDYPLTRFLLPVFNVPANAIGETLRRVPLYNRMPWMVEHAADLAGNNGAVSQAEAHGRSLLGASFLTAGYLMNQAGLLTGAGPQDSTDRKIWLQTHQPYSLRIGDTWVSYNKFDIIGGLLSIPATLSDLTVYHRAEDRSMAEASLVGVGALATWFKDRAALRGATQLLGLGDSPTDDPAGTVERMFGQIASGLVPASGLIRTLGVDTMDPYTRLKNDWDDYIRAGIPGLSQELEPMRNVLGEPINRPANSLGEAVFPVTFAPVATYREEPVLDELTRLYQLTGYSGGADPRSLGYGHFDPQEVKLEDGRSLYFHAMKARATMKLDGMTLKETLEELFNTPEYNEAVDADASQMETSRGDLSRGYMVRQVFDRYNRAIKANLGEASPIALRYLTAAAAKQRDDAYLRTVSLEDLVRNPDLYQANGIDSQAYSDAITEGAAGDLLEALGRGPE